ncbi:MAG TPA: DUF167 domain-containing protein [Vicinamibacterales bacterium]|nr:DUF167 domain-containing protein [Vicinamibacterales bacterium]
MLIEPLPGGVSFSVRVIPRSSSPGIAGIRDTAFLVRVKAAPVDDAANEELVALLARALQVPRRNVTIASGARSRLKRVRVAGIDASVAARALSPA